MHKNDLQTLKLLGKPVTVNGIRVQPASMTMHEFTNLPNHFTWSEEIRGVKRKGKVRGKHLEVFTPTQIQTMFVTVYTGVDKNTSVELFSAFDNKMAVDMPNDVLNYAFKEAGLKIKSPALQYNSTQAIKTACALLDSETVVNARLPIGAAIERTKIGLGDLDSLELGSERSVSRYVRNASAMAAYIALCCQFVHGRVAVMRFIKDPANAIFCIDIGRKHGNGGTQTMIKAEKIYAKLEELLDSKAGW